MFLQQIFGVNSEDALVLVTIGLAIITGIYAWQTKRTVSVLEKTAKQEFLPYIKPHIHMIGLLSIFSFNRLFVFNIPLRDSDVGIRTLHVLGFYYLVFSFLFSVDDLWINHAIRNVTVQQSLFLQY